MRKLFSLFLVSLLLTGCSNTPKPEPTPTATPEPTVEAPPEVEENKNLITVDVNENGYVYVTRDGDCYMDENGTFIHNHPLDLDNFIIDIAWANGEESKYGICTSFTSVPEDVEYYVQNNGQIPKVNKKDGTYQENIVEEVKRVCPADYEETSNRVSELKGK